MASKRTPHSPTVGGTRSRPTPVWQCQSGRRVTATGAGRLPALRTVANVGPHGTGAHREAGEPWADTPGMAIDITGKGTVTGYIDSAGDVDYFEMTFSEPSVFELAIDAPVGTEIAALDETGRVLAR